MAHFAQIDENNVVLQVLVVDNSEITDDNDEEQESLGVEFLRGLCGQETNWVQTSYNQNFRVNFAGIGDTYDSDADVFVKRKEYESWVLNTSTYSWEPPVPYPTDGQFYTWNESTLSWDLITE